MFDHRGKGFGRHARADCGQEAGTFIAAQGWQHQAHREHGFFRRERSDNAAFHGDDLIIIEQAPQAVVIDRFFFVHVFEIVRDKQGVGQVETVPGGGFVARGGNLDLFDQSFEASETLAVFGVVAVENFGRRRFAGIEVDMDVGFFMADMKRAERHQGAQVPQQVGGAFAGEIGLAQLDQHLALRHAQALVDIFIGVVAAESVGGGGSHGSMGHG